MRDRKTGFCLGDRYDVAHAPRSPPSRREPVYRSRCGLEQPGLLGIREGISVGYGDDYSANLEGQYLPLNGLRRGPLRARAPRQRRPPPARVLLRQQRRVAAAAPALARGRAADARARGVPDGERCAAKR